MEFAAGKAWELPDEAALQRLIARIDARNARARTPWGKLATPAAPIHFQRGGLPVGAGAEAEAGGVSLGSAAVETRRALGRRAGPDGTTWYYDADTTTSATIAQAIPAFGGKVRCSPSGTPTRRGR